MSVVFIFTNRAQWEAINTTIPVPSDWYKKEYNPEFWGGGRFITTLTATYVILAQDGNTFLCEKY